MKIRNGFVSNSSSSSFIIGYGVIKDKKKLLQILSELDISKYAYQLVDTSNIDEIIKENDYDDFDLEYRNLKPINKLLVHAGNNIVLKVPDKFYDKEILTVSINNNEGDEAFAETLDGYLDYSVVNEDYFATLGDESKIIDLFKNKDIFYKSDYKVGAERNG